MADEQNTEPTVEHPDKEQLPTFNEEKPMVSTIVEMDNGTYTVYFDERFIGNFSTLVKAREVAGDNATFEDKSGNEVIHLAADEVQPWKYGRNGSSVAHAFNPDTFASVSAYKHGVVTVLQFVYKDGSESFIKFASNSGLEIGGTGEMGTGQKLELQ